MNDKMKYSELKKAIEGWGKKWNLDTEVKTDENFTRVYSNGYEIAMVYVKKPYVFNLFYGKALDLKDNERRLLYEIITEYASTYPIDRDDNKKFYLKHRYIKSEGLNYLYISEKSEYIGLSTKDNDEGYKQKFTIDEIEEIKKKYNTSLKDFEIIGEDDEG